MSGLSAKAYKLTENYGKLPEFGLINGNKSKKAVVDTVQPGFANGLTRNYAAEFDGYVRLDSDGEYSFRLSCDDCGKVFIDGRLLAECAYDAGRDADATVSAEGALRLSAGYHKIRIEYAKVREGNAALSLEIGGGNYGFYTDG